MRPRKSFQAAEWESLEGRQLLSGASASAFPDLWFFLAQLNKNFVATPTPRPTPTPTPSPTPAPGGTSNGSNPQPQIMIPPSNVPPGYLDVRIKLTSADVGQLDAAADTFAANDTGGQDAARDSAAVAAFQASLDALDKTISDENHLPHGVTANLIDPLLNGVPLTGYEVNTLQYTVDVLEKSETYNRDGTANNPSVLNGFESCLNLLISNHPKPPVFTKK